MPTKIVITDACIFIDLYDLALTSSFFLLDLEIHTTSAVINELNAEQREILKSYQSDNRLTVHNLEEKDFLEIYSSAYPKSLSETDKSVLHIANKFNACVLSSDKVMRNCAKNKEIEYHGMIWIFDVFVSASILSKIEACAKLKQLVDTNMLFRNNRPLVVEIEKRFKIWNY